MNRAGVNSPVLIHACPFAANRQLVSQECNYLNKWITITGTNQK